MKRNHPNIFSRQESRNVNNNINNNDKQFVPRFQSFGINVKVHSNMHENNELLNTSTESVDLSCKQGEAAYRQWKKQFIRNNEQKVKQQFNPQTFNIPRPPSYTPNQFKSKIEKSLNPFQQRSSSLSADKEQMTIPKTNFNNNVYLSNTLNTNNKPTQTSYQPKHTKYEHPRPKVANPFLSASRPQNNTILAQTPYSQNTIKPLEQYSNTKPSNHNYSISQPQNPISINNLSQSVTNDNISISLSQFTQSAQQQPQRQQSQAISFQRTNEMGNYQPNFTQFTQFYQNVSQPQATSHYSGFYNSTHIPVQPYNQSSYQAPSLLFSNSYSYVSDPIFEKQIQIETQDQTTEDFMMKLVGDFELAYESVKFLCNKALCWLQERQSASRIEGVFNQLGGYIHSNAYFSRQMELLEERQQQIQACLLLLGKKFASNYVHPISSLIQECSDINIANLYQSSQQQFQENDILSLYQALNQTEERIVSMNDELNKLAAQMQIQ